MFASHIARVRVLLGAALIALAQPVAPAFADAATSRAAYQRAQTRFDAGDLRAARVELLNALKENRDNIPARLLYSRVLLARGEGVAAQAEIERAIASGAPRNRTHHLLAHALLLQREASRALDAAAPNRVPRQFASYAARMRARAHVALNNDKAAGAEFQNAVRLAPGTADNWIDLARYQASKRDVPRATASIDRALMIDPRSVEALALKGGLVRGAQGLEPALPFYNRALAIDDDNIVVLLERAATLGDLKREKEARADLAKVKALVPDHPLALYLEALLEARNGRFKEAQALLTRTKGQLDAFLPAQLLQGLVALQLGNVGQANEALSRVVAGAPGNLAARRMLGAVQLQRRDPGGALRTMEPILKLPIERLDAATLSLIGSAYAQSGDMASAQRYLDRASRLAPGASRLQTQLAMTKLAQGDLSGAEVGLDQALKADPNSLPALMSLVLLRMQERDAKGASAAAERIVKNYPNLPIGYNLRGAVAMGSGNPRAAEANFKAALQREPKFADARRNLAQVYAGTGRIEDARRELNQIVSDNPRDARALIALSQIAAARGQNAERVEFLRRAVTAEPNSFEPRAALIQAYLETGQTNQALADALALSRAGPTDPRATQVLGATQLAAGRRSDAVATFSRAAAARPDDVGAKILLGRAQVAAGQPGDARATYEAAARMKGAPREAIELELVRLDVGAKNFDSALRRANALKAQTRNKAAADQLIGDINVAAGRFPDAIAAYRRVQAADKTGRSALLVARGQMAAGDRGAALATLQDFRRRFPRDPAAVVALGDFYIATGDWRNAARAYEGLGTTPAARNPVILNNLAYAYSQIGDRRAIPTAEAALKGAPNAPEVKDTLGWLLFSTKADPKRGLALLEQAARGAPRNPTIRYHLGMAYRASGQRAQARTELQAALAAGPFPEANAARQALSTL